MANYHLSIKVLSRSTRNTVSALAYRSGTKLICERTGEVSDYRNKSVDHVELVLPENALLWIKALSDELKTNREFALQKLSDCIEICEKRLDSQVYRELEFTLPKELKKEDS